MQPTDEFIEDQDELQGDEAPAGSSKIVIWLVLFGLMILFLPLYVVSTTIKSTNEKLTTELEGIQSTLDAPPLVDPAKESLSAQLADIQAQNQALESIRASLMSAYINWPSVMASISAFDPNQMTVGSVVQIESGVRITGRAQQEIIAMAYADMLRASNLFDTVAVESITLQSIFMTATPMPTVTPNSAGGPTATPIDAANLTPEPTIELKLTDFIISVTIKKVNAGNGRS